MAEISSVLVVGAGGTGSILIEPLGRYLLYNGVWNVMVADLDEYEEKNATRQLFRPEDIGKNKALATCERLTCLPNLIPIEERIDYASIQQYLSGAGSMPCVITAVDNERSRHEIIKALDNTQANYVLINPGNSEYTCKVSIHVRRNGRNVTAHPFDRYENLEFPSDQLPGGCSEIVDTQPQTIQANMMSALGVMLYVNWWVNNLPMPIEIMGDIRKGVFNSCGQLLDLTKET